MAALGVRVRKQLPGFAVDLDLEVGSEVVVLAGRSGCGKTTTLHGIAGLIPLDAGRIVLDGRVLYDRAAHVSLPPEARGIAYLFQSYALFPHLSVSANVGFGLFALAAAERARRVGAILERLGIGHLRDARAHMLSGGERQRVALARALVTEPRALMLDEPLAALDVATRNLVRGELARILRTLTIPTLLVSHDIGDAQHLGDRIAVMDAGRVVQIGSFDQLVAHPASDFVADFTGTNLVELRSTAGGAARRIAFDPWRVRLARSDEGEAYAWSVRIVDIARSGGLVRLRLDGEVRIAAEISLEDWQAAPYALDEPVYALVAPRDVRAMD